MKERSLVAFTLLSQMAVGAFWVLGALHMWATHRAGPTTADALTNRALLAIFPLMTLGMLASFFHLGKPFDFWRVFANLRSSWLSREILFAVLFWGASGIFAALEWLNLGAPIARNLMAWAAALLGLALMWSMANAYRLRTIPAWDTWFTPVSFFCTAFLLGGLAVGVWLVVDADGSLELTHSSLQWITLSAVLLLGIELLLIPLWMVALATDQRTAARSSVQIIQEHSVAIRARLALMVGGLVVAAAGLSPWTEGAKGEIATLVVFGFVLASEVLGRSLFYESRVRLGV